MNSKTTASMNTDTASDQDIPSTPVRNDRKRWSASDVSSANIVAGKRRRRAPLTLLSPNTPKTSKQSGHALMATSSSANASASGGLASSPSLSTSSNSNDNSTDDGAQENYSNASDEDEEYVPFDQKVEVRKKPAKKSSKRSKPKRPKPFQRKVINCPGVRMAAIEKFNALNSKWRKGKFKAVKSVLRPLCRELMNNDAIHKKIFSLSEGDIDSAEDLEGMFQGDSGGGVSWFNNLFKVLKNPSDLLKSAMKNEKDGRGPFASSLLSTSQQNARKLAILEFMKR